MLPLSIRIPLGITIALFLIGIIFFIKRSVQFGTLPVPWVIAWAAATFILGAVTYRSWRRSRNK